MASPGADGEGLGVSPLQPRQSGDGVTWRSGGDAARLRRSRGRCKKGGHDAGGRTQPARLGLVQDHTAADMSQWRREDEQGEQA
jgi:hypothetical protein